MIMDLRDTVSKIPGETKIEITVTRDGPDISAVGSNYGLLAGAAALMAQVAAEADSKDRTKKRACDAIELMTEWAYQLLPGYLEHKDVLLSEENEL